MLRLKDDNGDLLEVPCGKCPACVRRKISQWSFRLMQEERASQSAHFLTLTYATDQVPLSRNGYMQLRKRDLQLFFKRLRKARDRRFRKLGIKPSTTIKYYGVGEYGGSRGRPHYHVLIFNCELELISKAWCTDESRNVVYGVRAFKVPSRMLGNIYYGKVSSASVGYSLKYMSKPPVQKKHYRDDRQKEFRLSSTKLGVGYLTPRMIRWHLADLENRMYVNLPGGGKASMPRYYKEKIYDEYSRDIVKRAQMACLFKRQAKEMEEQGEQYYHNQYQKLISDVRKMRIFHLQNQKL